MNLNHWFLALLAGVLVIALASNVHGQAQIASFTCKDGWCVITEREAERVVEVFGWLQNEVLRLKAQTGCT